MYAYVTEEGTRSLLSCLHSLPMLELQVCVIIPAQGFVLVWQIFYRLSYLLSSLWFYMFQSLLSLLGSGS